jgi:hypothetical protein
MPAESRRPGPAALHERKRTSPSWWACSSQNNQRMGMNITDVVTRAMQALMVHKACNIRSFAM